MKKAENSQEQKEKVVPNQEVSAKAQKAAEVDQSNSAGQPTDAAELKGKIAELTTSVEIYKDQLLRKAADFENYKKRIENEIINLTRFANENLIAELLPILDDFTRSLTMSRDRKDFVVFRRGVELIYSNFLKILEAQGVKPFDSIGKPFDVQYHDALMQLSKEGVPPNTVIEEVEKGYKLHDKVIRHAKVIVSQEPTENNEGGTREKVDRRSESDENTGEL